MVFFVAMQYVGDIGELVKTAKKSDSKVLKEDPALRKQVVYAAFSY